MRRADKALHDALTSLAWVLPWTFRLETVEVLASEIPNRNGVAHWISDITTTGFRKALGEGADTMSPIRHVQASDAGQILDVMRRYHWATAASRSYITDVEFTRERLPRVMGGATSPRPAFPPNDPTGVHRFSRG